MLQLGEEERCRQLARQIGTADVDPMVFGGFTALEAHPVGALLPDHLRALDEIFPIDDERAAFAGNDVLGLMEAEGRQRPLASERLTPPTRANGLRGIF